MTKYTIIGQAKDKKNNIRYFRVVEINSGRQATMSEEQIIDFVRKGEFSNATVDKLNRIRVYNKDINVNTEENKQIDIIGQLNKLMIGTPLKIRLNSFIWKQCILSGKEGSVYYFFDGSGITGEFALSERFINDKSNNVQINLDDNNPIEVTKLLDIFNNER